MSFELNDTLGCEVQYMANGHVLSMRATILFNGTGKWGQMNAWCEFNAIW